MRRIASAIAVAVVGAVVVIATVDAVQKAVEPGPAVPSPGPRTIDALTSYSGRLVWLDVRCRRHVTDLTSLKAIEAARRVPCRAELDPAGRLTPASRSGVERSSHGSYLVARRRGGLVARTREGEPLELPFRDARALVVSPDERWALAAGRRSAFLFRPRPGASKGRFRRVPIVATDLAWIP
jgi:hypothetical protein